MTLLASEFRTLRRHLNQTAGRIARQQITGKVHPGSQDLKARTIRLELGIDAKGKPILSPPVRWQEPAAGSFRVHSVPADNEQMVLTSPSGSVGTASLAVRATYDNDTSPPSQSAGEGVLRVGSSRIVMKDGEMTISADHLKLISDHIDTQGEKITHNDKNIGDTHEHTEVKKGADLTGPPAG
ncbi:phage baseplate protein [Breoghania sp.]|uniref:phage baseplate protein n=1 Tax=Breoghania sp. TaxID=2065378 RepID=UPI0029C9DCF9|nr:phage baseplate protein [Breoghania sp.]